MGVVQSDVIEGAGSWTGKTCRQSTFLALAQRSTDPDSPLLNRRNLRFIALWGQAELQVRLL